MKEDNIRKKLESKDSSYKREKKFSSLWPEVYKKIKSKPYYGNKSFSECLYFYFKGSNKDDKCKVCNKPLKYKGYNKGYGMYCSNKCINIGEKDKMQKNREETMIKKYGVKYPSQNKKILEKQLKTTNKKYGGNSPMCDKIVQEKSKKTLLKNFGGKNSKKYRDMINKRKEVFSKNCINWKEERNEKLRQNYIKKIKEELGEKFISYKNQKIKHICDCGKKTNEVTRRFYSFRKSNNRNVCVFCESPYSFSKSISKSENEIKEYIENFYTGKIIQSDRNILDNKNELDLYFPYKKLAIEYNGLYWHSEFYKEKNYHKIKTEKCKDNGIQLLHIWEDDWLNKKDIVKSMLKSKFGMSKRIYARKCSIKEISYKTESEFMDENHLQGKGVSKYRYGLFFNNKIMAVMSFSKLRKNLGSSHKDNVYELLRFCNKKNYSVIGGFSKLLQYFINQKNPMRIDSYADLSHSNGKVYEKNGFTLKSISYGNYWYFNNGVRENRYKYRKSELIKEGFDSSKSEHQIMTERGIPRIYGPGIAKYILSCDSK